MTKLAELRAAIEAQGCSAGGVRDGCGSWATCEVAIHRCAIHKTFSALDALEQALREDVLTWLDDGFDEEHNETYDNPSVSFAHRKLSEILNKSPTTGDTDG